MLSSSDATPACMLVNLALESERYRAAHRLVEDRRLQHLFPHVEALYRVGDFYDANCLSTLTLANMQKQKVLNYLRKEHVEYAAKEAGVNPSLQGLIVEFLLSVGQVCFPTPTHLSPMPFFLLFRSL